MKKLMILVFAAVMMTSFAAAQAGNTANWNADCHCECQQLHHPGLQYQHGRSSPSVHQTPTRLAWLSAPCRHSAECLTTGVTRTIAASNFTVSSPVDVMVTKANSTSANYTLTAQLATADATNTWTVGGVTVTSAAAATCYANRCLWSQQQFPGGDHHSVDTAQRNQHHQHDQLTPQPPTNVGVDRKCVLRRWQEYGTG